MRWIAALLLALVASAASAAPVIREVRAVRNNVLGRDGHEHLILGADFGYSVAVDSGEVVWTGGPNGWIEQATVGDTVEDAALRGDGTQFGVWYDSSTATNSQAVIGAASSVAYSGSQYLDASIDRTTGVWAKQFGWDDADSLDIVYTTWRQYFKPDIMPPEPSKEIQWKWFGITNWKSDRTKRGNTSCFRTLFIVRYDGATAPSLVRSYAQFGCGCQAYPSVCVPAIVPDPWFSYSGDPYNYLSNFGFHGSAWPIGTMADNSPVQGRWFRQEFMAKVSANADSTGYIALWNQQPDSTRNHIMTWNKLITRGWCVCGTEPGDCPVSDCAVGGDHNLLYEPWGSIHFENYWDDSAAPYTESADIFYDDIYIQIGTQARVEVGNNEVYANCTRLEIQYPTAWCRDGFCDGRIKFEFNRGRFKNGQTVYVFVIHDDGTASNGSPIILGETITPPEIPPNIRLD